MIWRWTTSFSRTKFGPNWRTEFLRLRSSRWVFLSQLKLEEFWKRAPSAEQPHLLGFVATSAEGSSSKMSFTPNNSERPQE